MKKCLVCKKTFEKKSYIYIPYLAKSICSKACLKYFKAKDVRIDKYLKVYDFLLVFSLNKKYLSKRNFYTEFKVKNPNSELSKNEVNSVFSILNKFYNLKMYSNNTYYCNYNIIHQFVLDCVNIEYYIAIDKKRL